MRCPACGGAELLSDSRDLPYTYKGETTTIADVRGEFCPVCGEVVLEREDTDRYMFEIGAWQKQVNATQVDPAFIARVRTKLNIGQREAGLIFGGGINAFNRYEAGKSKPPVSLVLLLGLLDRHPDLLQEVVASGG
mgnify:CR=1 FL=1